MRIFQKLEARILNLIGRAIVTLVNDSPKCQTLQIEIFKDELRDDVEHFQPYGLTFRPPVGSEVIALSPTGIKDNVVAICATYRDHRPTNIQAGEGGLYNATGFKFFVNASDVVNIAEKNAADFVALAAKVATELSNIRSYINSHTHTGVTSGGSSTGAPASPMSAPGSVAASKTKAT
jgi:phage gp45-like